MAYTISKEFEFAASHQLRGLPDEHQCARLHGHNYRVRVELTGHLDPTGFVLDYGALAPFKRWIDANLDHRHLNDIPRFDEGGDNPTAEGLSQYLTAALHSVVEIPRSILTRVWVSETPKTWAVWTP